MNERCVREDNFFRCRGIEFFYLPNCKIKIPKSRVLLSFTVVSSASSRSLPPAPAVVFLLIKCTFDITTIDDLNYHYKNYSYHNLKIKYTNNNKLYMIILHGLKLCIYIYFRRTFGGLDRSLFYIIILSDIFNQNLL